MTMTAQNCEHVYKMGWGYVVADGVDAVIDAVAECDREWIDRHYSDDGANIDRDALADDVDEVDHTYTNGSPVIAYIADTGGWMMLSYGEFQRVPLRERYLSGGILQDGVSVPAGMGKHLLAAAISQPHRYSPCMEWGSKTRPIRLLCTDHGGYVGAIVYDGQCETLYTLGDSPSVLRRIRAWMRAGNPEPVNVTGWGFGYLWRLDGLPRRSALRRSRYYRLAVNRHLPGDAIIGYVKLHAKVTEIGLADGRVKRIPTPAWATGFGLQRAPEGLTLADITD